MEAGSRRSGQHENVRGKTLGIYNTACRYECWHGQRGLDTIWSYADSRELFISLVPWLFKHLYALAFNVFSHAKKWASLDQLDWSKVVLIALCCFAVHDAVNVSFSNKDKLA